MRDVKHPFFHTLVVMSATLVGCGGVASDQSDGEGELREPDEISQGQEGSGGAHPTVVASSGGVMNVEPEPDDPPEPEPVKDPVVLPPGDCPPEQWACDDTHYYMYQETEAGYVDGYLMPSNCTCEPVRPRVAGDCPPGETVACLEVAFLDEETPLDRDYAVSCICVPDAEWCAEECDAYFADSEQYADGYDCQDSADAGLTLCGAAYVLLK